MPYVLGYNQKRGKAWTGYRDKSNAMEELKKVHTLNGKLSLTHITQNTYTTTYYINIF